MFGTLSVATLLLYPRLLPIAKANISSDIVATGAVIGTTGFSDAQRAAMHEHRRHGVELRREREQREPLEVERLRDVERFESLERLKKQLEHDRSRALAVLRRSQSPVSRVSQT